MGSTLRVDTFSPPDMETRFSMQKSQRAMFLSLPPELQLEIFSHLDYPDALSLKHTSRHFYNTVDTGIKLKVAWLMQRSRLALHCPRTNCIFSSDQTFCSKEVRRLMERRRWHEECTTGRCLVVSQRLCGGPGRRSNWRARVVSAWLDYDSTEDRKRFKEMMPLGGTWLLALILAAVLWWYVGDEEWGRRESGTELYNGKWIL